MLRKITLLQSASMCWANIGPTTHNPDFKRFKFIHKRSLTPRNCWSSLLTAVSSCLLERSVCGPLVFNSIPLMDSSGHSCMFCACMLRAFEKGTRTWKPGKTNYLQTKSPASSSHPPPLPSRSAFILILFSLHENS